MKTSGTAAQKPVEIELKLALPTADPATLAQRLAGLPLLARRKASRQALHNIYYDTPDDALHHRRIALRLRRVGDAAHPQWLQTLKVGGNDDSALSRRGEWEDAVSDPALSAELLQATPWPELDPEGAVFQALEPRFTTDFQRTRWTVRQRDGSAVEVALDMGHIVVGTQSAAICELELELLAGDASALFQVAHQIARDIAVLPLGISKAERGYALAQNTLQQPRRAQPPALTPDTPVAVAAARVLREMFSQFTHNLVMLEHSDDPELVHQARVAWRRFKSGLKLFRKTAGVQSVPGWQDLLPLLHALGGLRDLDVAHLETLPMLANAYAAGNSTRQAHWRAMQESLVQAADQQRQLVRATLSDPTIGANLLALTEWLESGLSGDGVEEPAKGRKTTLRRWAQRRVARLREQLKASLKDVDHPESAHRARILSKRLRYSIEALRPLLPKRRAHRWYQWAAQVQGDMGAERDLQQALEIAARLQAHIGLQEFLRGVQARMTQAR